MGRRSWALVAALVLVGSGCGTQEEPQPDPAPAASVQGSPASIEELCGYEAEGEYLELRSSTGDSVLPGYSMGEGDQSVVLLAQLTGRGSCDWIGYAEWLAEHDVQVVAIDLCGQGKSRCTEAVKGAPAQQVELAVTHLRDGGAERVTVVGASMGASIAQGVGHEVGADAVVAISPPPEWPGTDDVETAAGKIDVPWLLVAAADDDIDPPRLKKAREGSSAPGEYREVPGSDHGYALITDGNVLDPELEPLGKEILAWVQGDLPEG